MLPFKRTFEPEKRQLQELNCRLAQYLNRTKQLEQENASLLGEIGQLRQTRARERQEPAYKAEMRELRRAVEQLSSEKSQAEMERERLRRELQAARSLCEEQTGACRDVAGELRGCALELDVAHKTNEELQQRLFQLEGECQRLEEAHRRETEMAPALHAFPAGSPAVSVDDVQEFAFGLSEGWVKTFDMYQQKVEEMERAVREDQARLRDMEREKVAYAAELERTRAEAQRHEQAQMRLEQELADMQHKFQTDFGEYQMIIDELQREREMMAHSIEQKMVEHEQLLKHKMDLGLELAAYRVLIVSVRTKVRTKSLVCANIMLTLLTPKSMLLR
uniref:IF rod domain-containing protein n=1 Tax=Neogobius melanostomus TaxID=47308 RepID=A0A8C6UQR0_9GOBI